MTHHKIILKTSQDMCDLQPDSVDLVVTSPPYNVGKDYGESDYSDSGTYREYLDMLRVVFTNCFTILKPYRFMCVNVGRDTNVPLVSDITRLCCDIGFRYNKNIVWEKPQGAANQTFMYKYPYPRYYEPYLVTENILVFTKGEINGHRPERMEENKIMRRFIDEFPTNIWFINPESDNGVLSQHPCPFPEQLVENCIRFYSNPGEIVLDPFLGSGTTMKVAKRMGRDSIGFEINPKYKDLILCRTGFAYEGLSEDTFEVIE